MSCTSARLRTTCLCTWLSAGTSMTMSPRICVEQLKRRPLFNGNVFVYSFSVSLKPERCSALDLTPCLAKLPKLGSTWQRPHKPRPPHTESISTPSARAACNKGVPKGKRPRRPDGVNTTKASSDIFFLSFRLFVVITIQRHCERSEATPCALASGYAARRRRLPSRRPRRPSPSPSATGSR